MFQIGDRVIMIKDDASLGLYKGDVGVIVHDKPDNHYVIGIEFDHVTDGHDCIGRGRNNHCWYVESKYIDLLMNTPREEIKHRMRKVLQHG